MGDDDALEGEVEKGAQSRQRALLMGGGRPHTQLASLLRQRVGENKSALLGQPQRRFIAAASVIKREETSGKLAAGLDELEFGLGDILAKEETRAEREGIIAAREEIDVANVIGLENDDGSWWARVEPLPKLGCA